MSSDEIVDAYIEGQITRRTLIRRLAATGVSLGAATAYAHLLAPGAQARQGTEGCVPASEYPGMELRIKSTELKTVINDAAVDVKVRAADPGDFRIDVFVRKHSGRLRRIGTAKVTFTEAGAELVSVPLTSVELLEGRDRAKLWAFGYWLAGELCEGNPFLDSDAKAVE